MESDAFALRTAVFSLLGALLLGVAWVVLNDQQGEYSPYLVVTEDSVSGLAVQSKVYYKGVEAGTVVDIFFAEQDFDRVHILVHIDRSIPIAANTFARLALRGITGEYDLRLDNDGPLGTRLTTSESAPAVIEMRTEYITKLASSSERVLADVSQASARLAALLDDHNQREIKRLLTGAANAAEEFAALEELLAPTLQRLPSLLDKAESTLADYRRLAQGLNVGSDQAGPALAKFSAASESIDRLAQALRTSTLTDINASLAGINRASSELSLLLEDVRQDPQRLLLGAPDSELGPGESPGSRQR